VHGDEAQFRRRDGTQFFGSLSVDQVRQDSGVFLLVMLEDITQRRAWREKIYHQAHYDALTDLPNRRLMLDRVNQAMDDAQRRQRWAAVLFLDLDCFKQVNDSLGHDVGDRLLKEVAARLKAVVRRGDTICRHGGDEFVVVLTDLDHPQDASAIAVKILEALRLPIAVDQNRLTATTSIGIGVYPDGSTPDANELVKKADEAMYAAKQDGGNRYCCRDDAVESSPG
jgi:diguanylate cyclase (GGDEF)-like protein